MHSGVHCSTVYNSQDMEVTIEKGIGKEDVVYIYTMEYYSSIIRMK